MANINNSNRNLPRDPWQGADGALLGFGGLAGLAVIATSMASVFGASVLAGVWILLALAVFLVVLWFVVRSAQRPKVALALLAAGTIWTACFGFIVFDNHWLAFTPATWVLDGLFIAALVSGAWATLNAWARALAVLSALALVTATKVLPRPPGGDGPGDTAEKWTVDVDATDSADGTPLEGARVLCGTALPWEMVKEGNFNVKDTSARITDRTGRVDTWEFDEDPRLKVVVCTVWKPADDGNAGYPSMTQVSALVGTLSEEHLHFVLMENPHPDTAFLALDLTGSYASGSWYTLKFEVWEGEPQGYVGSADGPQPLARKAWQELKGGFSLSAAQAANGVTLRYSFEGPAPGDGLGPPYNEVQTIPVDPIPAGTRRRVALRIPANQGHD